MLSRSSQFTVAAAATGIVVLGSATLRYVQELFLRKGRPLARQQPLRRRLRVAIIGAGVGGSALAQWLRDLYGEDLELTVVSDGPVGGRCQIVEMGDGLRYEGGAAIISELNEYMMGFIKRLGLKEKFFKRLDVPLGLFDGNKFLVREKDPTSAPLGLKRIATFQTAWRFLSRYGFMNLRRLKSLMRHRAAPNFARLYRFLHQGRAFTTPEALLDALGSECRKLTQVSAAEWLVASSRKGGGLTANIVDELVTGGMRCNYGGQGCETLHALVGLVSIAGGFASRCFAVSGGNYQVPQGLVASARPERLLSGVTARSVRRVPNSRERTWEISVEPGAPGEAMKGAGSPARKGQLHTEGPFDIVVVAHPLERSCLKFEDIHPESPVNGACRGLRGFQRCVTHFVRGVLRAGYFMQDGVSCAEAPVMQVLTVAGSCAPFYSIGLQIPVDVKTESDAQKILDGALNGELSTFKVFAPEPLTEMQLDDIFEKREGHVKVLDWYAYPEYTARQQLASFLLDGEEDASLLYLNAIEQTASAMEMSAVSARNAANLVVQFVEQRRGNNARGGGF